jgi:hypothetical protein
MSLLYNYHFIILHQLRHLPNREPH